MKFKFKRKMLDVKFNKRYSVYITKDGVVLDPETMKPIRTWLNKSNTGRSYPCAMLTDSFTGKTGRVYIHRIVAYTYCPGYEKGKVVDHIDNNPLNHHPSNLQWVTQSENISKNPRGKSKKAKQ